MKFALIGNGFIASKHREAIEKVGGELVSVCDIDPRKEIPGIKFFADYRDALEGVDAVAICTPNDTHAEMILEAARRGLKILSEKPVTFKLREFELMKGVPNLFGVFQLRYLPEISEMRKAAKNAKLIELKVEMKRSRNYYESWKGDDKRTGGLLVNIGCHYFDLVGHLFGYDGFEAKSDIGDTEAQGEMVYPDGRVVLWNLAFTDEQPIYERSLTIDGKKFDLVQKENLHIKTYENFMWAQGIPVKEEEKILNMIYSL